MRATSARTAGSTWPGGTARAVDPPRHVRLDRRVQVAAVQRGALRVEERPQIRRDFREQRPGRRREQQRGHRRRPGQRGLDRHAGAEGGADQMTALDADVGQCAENVTGLRDRPGRPLGRIAESPQVQPHDVPLPGERGPDRIPHPPIGDAGVDQHDRQLAPRPVAVIGDAVRRIRSHSPPRRRSLPAPRYARCSAPTTGFARPPTGSGRVTVSTLLIITASPSLEQARDGRVTQGRTPGTLAGANPA